MVEHDGSLWGLGRAGPFGSSPQAATTVPKVSANTLLFSHHPLPSGNFPRMGFLSGQVSPSLPRVPGGPARAGRSRGW